MTALVLLTAPDSAWYFDAVAEAKVTPWLNGPAMLFTRYGLVVFGVVVLVLLVTSRTRSDARLATVVWVPLAAGVAATLGLILKTIVAEPRPCLGLPAGSTLWTCDASGSFPSNHAAMAAAAAVALLFVDRTWGWLAIGFALLMAGSRVYIGAHYPHDVVAGLILGALVGALSPVLRRPLAAGIHRIRGSAPARAMIGRRD